MFGVMPAGLWPSEGSVSDEALALAADCGFTWAASDNGVLSRTLGTAAGIDETYQAYLWRQQTGREMRMLFRDHYLSDLIGFKYSRMGAEEAAEHFLCDGFGKYQPARTRWSRLFSTARMHGSGMKRTGVRFCASCIDAFPRIRSLEALTVSEALAQFEAEPLAGNFSGVVDQREFRCVDRR